MITAAELELPRFKCGHFKTGDNSYVASYGKNGNPYVRCKKCTDKKNTEWTKLNRQYLKNLESAMRVIRTWAAVPGCLDAQNVLNLIDKTLKK